MRSWVLALAAVALVFPGVANAGLVSYTAQYSGFVGPGGPFPYAPFTIEPVSGVAGVTVATAGSFTLPAGVFALDTSRPGTVLANTAPNSIYVVTQITNQASHAGSFGPGMGFGGGFGGTLGAGSRVSLLLGTWPFANVLGTAVVPLDVGVSGTATSMVSFLTNAVNLQVTARNWTTGRISGDDGEVSGVHTSYIVTGSRNLTASGGTLTLVAPFRVTLSGQLNEVRVGYATLELTFVGSVPEPGATLLLSAGALGLAGAGRLRGGARRPPRAAGSPPPFSGS